MTSSVLTESRRNVVALTVTGVAVTATLAGWSPSIPTAVVIVGLAAAVGMPHGALDVAVGPRHLPRRAFFNGYGLLALATVVLWFAAPVVALAAFFTMSWFHFGSGDASHHLALGEHRFAHGVATGGAVLGLPLALHAGLVGPVLNDLLLGRSALDDAAVTSAGVAMVAVAAVAGMIVAVHALRTGANGVLAELGAIFVLGAVVHPLVSFAVYFALWHSPRHLLDLDIDRRAVVPTILATIATFAAAGTVWTLAEPSVALATRIVFIGLAALTTPHLVTTEMLRRRSGVASTIAPAGPLTHPLPIMTRNAR